MESESAKIRWMFINEGDEFFNWSNATIAVLNVIKALYDDVETIAKECIEMWPAEERNHLEEFAKHNGYTENTKTEYRKRLTTLECTSQHCTCTKVFDQLRELNTTEQVTFLICEPSQNKWWTLLSFFLPNDSAGCKSLDKCRLASLRKLFENCLLFEDFAGTFYEIVDIRNTLLHSATHHLTTSAKNNYFRVLKEFVRKLKSQEIAVELENLQMDLRFSDTDTPSEQYTQLQNALEQQFREIEKEIEYADKCLSMDVQKFQTHLKKCKESIANIEKSDSRLVTTLSEVAEMGADMGEQELGGGLVGATVGRFSGGVGATAAGLYRLATEK